MWRLRLEPERIFRTCQKRCISSLGTWNGGSTCSTCSRPSKTWYEVHVSWTPVSLNLSNCVIFRNKNPLEPMASTVAPSETVTRIGSDPCVLCEAVGRNRYWFSSETFRPVYAGVFFLLPRPRRSGQIDCEIQYACI